MATSSEASSPASPRGASSQASSTHDAVTSTANRPSTERPKASKAAVTATEEASPEQSPSDESSKNDDQRDGPSTVAGAAKDQPPLPNEAPPLPNEPAPGGQDDGWDCHWDQNNSAWFFHNRYTNQTTWENPRAQPAAAAPGTAAPGTSATASTAVRTSTSDKPVAGGYNPAIHGDYDPNAWYAQGSKDEEEATHDDAGAPGDPSALYSSTATFNRFTGQFQTADQGPDRHNDESKSRRQMNAFFDVDAAANSHDGRSLKAERSGKKPTKSELKHFKEKRRARKEEKRRAWLRD